MNENSNIPAKDVTFKFSLVTNTIFPGPFAELNNEDSGTTFGETNTYHI